ncbi:hypothetical protein Bca4012_034579 [Brassica carinata]
MRGGLTREPSPNWRSRASCVGLDVVIGEVSSRSVSIKTKDKTVRELEPELDCGGDDCGPLKLVLTTPVCRSSSSSLCRAWDFKLRRSLLKLIKKM